MKKTTKATVKAAKAIMKYAGYKRSKPEESCGLCHGKGITQEESGHNGDFYDIDCPCVDRDEPPLPGYSALDKELIEMAKLYLEHHK